MKRFLFNLDKAGITHVYSLTEWQKIGMTKEQIERHEIIIRNITESQSPLLGLK